MNPIEISCDLRFDEEVAIEFRFPSQLHQLCGSVSVLLTPHPERVCQHFSGKTPTRFQWDPPKLTPEME